MAKKIAKTKRPSKPENAYIKRLNTAAAALATLLPEVVKLRAEVVKLRAETKTQEREIYCACQERVFWKETASVLERRLAAIPR